MSRCRNCGSKLPKNSKVCKQCGTRNEPVNQQPPMQQPYAAPVQQAAPAVQPNFPPVILEVGDIGIRVHSYGNTVFGFGMMNDENLRITNGPECFNNIVWTDIEFAGGVDLSRTRDFEFYCTYRGNVGKMVLDVDLSELELPYRIGVMISDDLMMHFFIGSDADNLEYVCKFLPADAYQA